MWQYKVRFLLEVALKISTANFAKRICRNMAKSQLALYGKAFARFNKPFFLHSVKLSIK